MCFSTVRGERVVSAALRRCGEASAARSAMVYAVLNMTLSLGRGLLMTDSGDSVTGRHRAAVTSESRCK